MTLPVKYYSNTMQGAPQLTNDWGCMTALLDAVLITGFNLKTIETLTGDTGDTRHTGHTGHTGRTGRTVGTGAGRAGRGVLSRRADAGLRRRNPGGPGVAAGRALAYPAVMPQGNSAPPMKEAHASAPH